MVTATTRFLSAQAIPAWLADLAARMAVYAPMRLEGRTSFGLYDAGKELDLEGESVSPPKQAVFPQTKTLLRFAYSRNPENPEDKLLEIVPEVDSSPALVFGARPCGAKGFTTYNQVFAGKGAQDPYYKSRRDNTTIVTIACDSPRKTCFCNWVGGGPDDVEGSDVLLVPVAGGYAAQGITEKGQALIGQAPFADGAGKADEAAAVCAKAKEAMEPAKDISKIGDALKGLFPNLDFWDKMTSGCVGCGACTYLCPTCYCFNITDESDGQAGARVRTWDSCMTATYSLEASGHNPRPTKAYRLRNRIGHKFWYHPKNHDGTISCCGCGRCTKYCPGGVDLRYIIQEALKLHEG